MYGYTGTVCANSQVETETGDGARGRGRAAQVSTAVVLLKSHLNSRHVAAVNHLHSTSNSVSEGRSQTTRATSRNAI